MIIIIIIIINNNKSVGKCFRRQPSLTHLPPAL